MRAYCEILDIGVRIRKEGEETIALCIHCIVCIVLLFVTLREATLYQNTRGCLGALGGGEGVSPTVLLNLSITAF